MFTLNYLQVVTCEQNAIEREMGATGKATDVARVDYEDLPTHKSKSYIHLNMTNGANTDVINVVHNAIE